MGDVVVVLDLARSYDWNPALYYVARGGALFGDVDSMGTAGFPALGEESRTFVGQLVTPALIASEANRVKPVLDVTFDPETGKVVSRR